MAPRTVLCAGPTGPATVTHLSGLSPVLLVVPLAAVVVLSRRLSWSGAGPQESGYAAHGRLKELT